MNTILGQIIRSQRPTHNQNLSHIKEIIYMKENNSANRLSPRKILKEEGKLNEAIRFAIVGGIATVIQYGIYVVFVDAVKVPAVPSQLISYAISFIFNYILSSLFTFHKKPNAKNALGFTASHAINMGLQAGLVAIFKGIVGNTLALLPALAICIPVNFFLVRFVFNSRFFQKK